MPYIISENDASSPVRPLRPDTTNTVQSYVHVLEYRFPDSRDFRDSTLQVKCF